MNRKKWISLLLVFSVMAGALAGCSPVEATDALIRKLPLDR